jgi:hypothetical protein
MMCLLRVSASVVCSTLLVAARNRRACGLNTSGWALRCRSLHSAPPGVQTTEAWQDSALCSSRAGAGLGPTVAIGRYLRFGLNKS